ncbi:MAG: head GIN domain-containing protein [Dysgonomonas sp.]|nr:head GIN domain-containing protein [Dysgonomonas sp.]
MKTLIYTLTVAFTFLAFHSCYFNAVEGNGNITENTVSISDYKNIEFSGGATLIYEQKTDVEPYLKIEIDENLFPILKIGVNDSTLSIENKENIRATKYVIYTNSSKLAKIGASGSLKAHLKGRLETDKLDLAVSGSGNIIADSLICNTVISRVSGSGNIILTGKTNTFESHVSGSGKTDAINLLADNVTCSLSGSGDFTVHAEKTLNVQVSGSGKVNYKGDPQISQSISGSGKINKID